MYAPKYFPPTFRQLPADTDFVVGIPFLWSGRQYQPGELFNRSIGTLAQIRRLYNGRKLAPAPFVAEGRDDPPAPAEPSPPLAVKHLGFGKWCVVQGSDRIGDPKSKEEAEAELAILAA